MPLTASILAGWRIEANSDAAPVARAAAELRTQLGAPPDTTTDAGVVRLVLHTPERADDGFEATIASHEIELRSNSARGLLNAAYWLLERLGFTWVEPGERGVCFRATASLAEGSYSEAPAFERRTLILGQDALQDDWRDWIEWASRNRLNDVFFHDTPPSSLDRAGAKRPASAEEQAADGHGWMFELWDREGAAIRELAAKRGMRLQFGGHHLPAMVPRAAFVEHPEWFPLRKGVRDPQYNLCVSSPGARAHLRAGALAFFARFPGADVFHLWADDIPGGGWCECDDCKGLTPSDQALEATNIVAEALAGVLPDARVAHLAYHDTVQPPTQVQPAANVTLLWAPRERCYAHAIDDERCPKNRNEYWEPYLGLLELFGRRPERVQVFEYYSDAILFKGLAPTHLGTLPGDVKAYAVGAGNLQNLMVGNRPWVGPPWHAWWMARCLWDSQAVLVEALGEFCEAAFPENAAAMVAYYSGQERAYRQFLDLHNLREMPRHDVLDFSDRPRATLNAKGAELLEGAFRLRNAEKSIFSLAATNQAEADRLARERTQAAAVASIAAHIGNRVAAWDANLDGLR
ncbi:MAG: DUF4838 domain-containing protein, partial [Tepidiformaceae bacterium]